MKIAVSVPDDVFEDAERLARRMKRSRSEVYSRALAEYVARHAPDRVTEAMDRTLAEIDKTDLTERTGKLPRSKLELVLSGIDVVLGR
jgi:predicted transcriptional regulator